MSYAPRTRFDRLAARCTALGHPTDHSLDRQGFILHRILGKLEGLAKRAKPITLSTLANEVEDAVKSEENLASERSDDNASISDASLLDFLEKQGQGKRWIARPSRLGRGYRLHNCEADEFPVTYATAREALTAAVKEETV